MTSTATCRSLNLPADLALATVLFMTAHPALACQPPVHPAADQPPLSPAAQIMMSEILDIRAQIQPAGPLSLSDSAESQRLFAEQLANTHRQAAQTAQSQPLPPTSMPTPIPTSTLPPTSTPMPASTPVPMPTPSPETGWAAPDGLPPVSMSPASSGEANYADRRSILDSIPPTEPWLEQVPAVLNPHSADHPTTLAEPSPGPSASPSPNTSPNPTPHLTPSPSPELMPSSPGGAESGSEAGMIESLRQTSSQLDQLANQLEHERRYHDADQLRQLAQRLRAEARERDPNPPIEAGPVVPISFGPHALRQPTPPPDGTSPAVYPTSFSY